MNDRDRLALLVRGGAVVRSGHTLSKRQREFVADIERRVKGRPAINLAIRPKKRRKR